jgi:hypothetical protein
MTDRDTPVQIATTGSETEPLKLQALHLHARLVETESAFSAALDPNGGTELTIAATVSGIPASE